MGFAERGKSCFQLFGGGAALAADAQYADAGDKVQRISGREKGQGEVCCVLRLGRNYPAGAAPGRENSDQTEAVCPASSFPLTALIRAGSNT